MSGWETLPPNDSLTKNNIVPFIEERILESVTNMYMENPHQIWITKERKNLKKFLQRMTAFFYFCADRIIVAMCKNREQK